jgi:hypothetical protein
MYNDTMTNSMDYMKNRTHEWNGSGIYSSNDIVSLSLVINDSYRDFGYVNIKFVYQSDRRNVMVTAGY